MDTITIQYPNTPLTHPIRITLDLRTLTLTATTTPPGRDEDNSLVLSWMLPHTTAPVSVDSLHDLLDEIQPLALQVVDYSKVITDTDEPYGCLGPIAAETADEIERIISAWRPGSEDGQLVDIDIAAWAEMQPHDPAREYGIGPDTSDNEIDKIAARVEKDVRDWASRMHGVGSDVVRVSGAREWVEDQRREARFAELHQVVEQLQALQARRDVLMCDLYFEDRVSTREIAEYAGMTHVAVWNRIKQAQQG